MKSGKSKCGEKTLATRRAILKNKTQKNSTTIELIEPRMLPIELLTILGGKGVGKTS